ncbi:uncharacterized protein [Amphiura filiformis]|uniref:uncharacterized protein n=1 Tax=Amphiura filiformis TaxID=82378 RepID=UPI003B225415
MAAERKDKVFMAKLAEEMGRYEDMVGHMKDIIAMESDEGLSIEERSLLSVAYKNVIGARRASWRVTYGLEQRYKGESKEDLVKLTGEYRKTIENELIKFCAEVLDLVDNRLYPKATAAEYKVFYLKMKGDCYRYQAEIYTSADGKKDITENAQKAYEAAEEIAKLELKTTDPTRLGLTLNFSVFLYEILNQQQRACQVAKESFEGAMNDLQEKDGSYDDTTMILQSMRDNLILWTNQDSSDDDDEDTQEKKKEPSKKEEQKDSKEDAKDGGDDKKE